MSNNAAAVKVTLEINQDTNLDELVAHLCLMKSGQFQKRQPADSLLPDFSIHEGELEPDDAYIDEI